MSVQQQQRKQNPVEFNVWFTTSEEGLHRRGTTRSLLNVAQHRFTVPQVATREPRGAAVLLPEDRSDRVDEEQQLVMLVSAVREGVPAPGMSDDGIVRYNIGILAPSFLDVVAVVLMFQPSGGATHESRRCSNPVMECGSATCLYDCTGCLGSNYTPPAPAQKLQDLKKYHEMTQPCFKVGPQHFFLKV